MRILWITNVALPEASELRGRTASPFGGWLTGAASHLAPHVELSVASPAPSADPGGPVRSSCGTHYEFTSIVDEEALRGSLSEILKIARPDIVHIFGTEYGHARQAAELCREQSLPFVVSIQGLVSVYATHYMGGLPLKVQTRFTLRDLVRRDNILLQRAALRRRGINEIATLRAASDVIGRTTWDEACAIQVNPKANYHTCNEIARPAFYQGRWNVRDCERFSIFVTQGSYPIKGLHLLLKAMPLILRRFPDATIVVAGPDVTGEHSLAGRLKRTSYGKYLRELITEGSLDGHVSFTGPLDEANMHSRYLNSHVFALPSTIENSPNSLAEAMLLGVPTVASAVGGVMDMARCGVDALTYQADAPYMLAHQVCRIFSSDHLADQLANNAQSRAQTTHDARANTARLITIYQAVLSASGNHDS